MKLTGKIIEKSDYPVMADPIHTKVLRRNKITGKEEEFLITSNQEYITFCQTLELYPRLAFDCQRCSMEVDECLCIGKHQRVHRGYHDILPRDTMKDLSLDLDEDEDGESEECPGKLEQMQKDIHFLLMKVMALEMELKKSKKHDK